MKYSRNGFLQVEKTDQCKDCVLYDADNPVDCALIRALIEGGVILAETTLIIEDCPQFTPDEPIDPPLKRIK